MEKVNKTTRPLQILSFIILYLLLNACANIQAPGGGPKDEKAPKLINSIPAHNSKNFNGTKITLEFNERIQLKNIDEQLIINPTPKGEYESSIRRNILYLTFSENFLPNTTYTFNFRDAIEDITEKNTSKNLQLAFSTGNDLDTNFIQGIVLDLQSNQPVANALISLYAPEDTSTVFNAKPLYFIKTDKTGSFKINNVRKNVYDIYAFSDINKNYVYDSERENIAFLKNQPVEGALELNLYLSKGKLIPVKIMTEKSISAKEFQLTFNKGLEEFKLKENNLTKDLYLTTSEDGKLHSIFTKNSLKDSIPLDITFKDSLGNTEEKTIYIEFKEPERKTKAMPALGQVIKKVTPSDLKVEPGKSTFTIDFYKPITQHSINKVLIKKDSLPIKEPAFSYAWNRQFTSITFAFTADFKDSLVIYLAKATFIDIHQDSSLAIKYKLRYKAEEDFAVLDGKVITKEPNYILQLTDEKFNVKESIINGQTFNFNYIPAGTYYLRAILDENKNNKWDAGSVKDNAQPERIIFYKEKIVLRANWEITGIEFKF